MVEILLAVYNGEKYLKQQIDSIINQSYENWKLLIFDDGSNDATEKIVSEYVKQMPNKIFYEKSLTNSKSAVYSFAHLLNLSKEKYVAFCDHDDVWIEDKLKISVNAIKRLEKEFFNEAILVYTDLFVVDENLKLIKKSMMKSQKLKLKEKPLNRLLVQNNVTGCTMLFNRQLINICGKIPKSAVMHDWWLSLVAAAFGKTKFLNVKTVHYRQHSNNQIGFKKVGSLKYIAQRLKNKSLVKKSIELTYQQAENFLRIYEKKLKKEHIDVLKEYLKLKDYCKFRRIFKMFLGGFLKDGILRKLGQVFYI